MNLKMTSRERVFAALRGEKTDHPPVVCINQHATYEQMEKLGAGWPEAHRDAEKMAALAAGGCTLLGLDAIRVPYCQTFEAQALGAGVKDGGRTNLPSIDRHPYKIGDQADLPADFLQRGRIPELLKAVKILKNTVGDKVVIMGGIIGPFSIATSLLGITDMLMKSFKEPDAVRPYIELSAKAGTVLANALTEAGADVIVIEDMMASLDMISPKIFRELAVPYQKIQIKTRNAPTIIHICGKLDALMPDIAGTGATAISVEHTVNVPQALEKFRELKLNVPIIGAIDPVKTLYQGTPADIAAEVAKSYREGISLIAPGCAVPPATPIENLVTMVEAVRNLGSEETEKAAGM